MALRTTYLAALLIAFSFFNAFGIFAANSDTVLRATFSPVSPLTGELRIGLQNNTITPVFIYGMDSNGARFPLSFDLEKKDINLHISHGLSNISGIVVTYHSKTNRDTIQRARVFSGNAEVPGRWVEIEPQTTGVLVDVTDSLAFYTVAVIDTHTLSFTTTTTPLADTCSVWVIFPSGFDISSVSNAIYSDDDPSNDGNEPSIASIDIDGHNLLLRFGTTGVHAAAGSRIALKFWPAINHQVAQSYTLLVFTTTYGGEINNGPVDSEPFDLQPGSFHHIAISPDTAVTVQAGTFLQFSAGAQDTFNNQIDSISFNYLVLPDSCGNLNGNNFMAAKLGSCYIAVSGAGITDSIGPITVIPGALERFYIFGYPESDTAGSSFGGTVRVGAFDNQNNRKRDYLGSIWFYGDAIDSLPFRSGNPYTFTVGDSGLASFQGISFSLNRAGIRNFTVTNGSISATSSPIRIFAAPITSFTLLTDSVHVAGEPFYIDVVGAVDRFDNQASGEVVISDSIGGGSSPDGIPPWYNNVIVTSGSGRSFQTMTNAVQTVLKGRSIISGTVNITRLFQVNPGVFSRYELAGYPDRTTAGENFIQDIRVYAYDLYGNIKTNYDGWIYFESTDSLATLPFTSEDPFHFMPEYSGMLTFAESLFVLRTAGSQFLTVTDSVYSTQSQGIIVSPASISDFTLVAPSAAVAGVPFAVSVTNAHDQWGNPTSGTVTVADSVGGGPSPNGTMPIYMPITVVGGGGSANQTLFNTVSTLLKGAAGSVIRTAGPISVGPGVVGNFYFQVSSPQVDGYPFFGSAGLTAYDRYSNIKTDFNASTDSVVITSLSFGRLTNNVLRLPGDFIGGNANLITLGTTYFGPGGSLSFRAASRSGAYGISNQVEITALTCTAMNIDQASISHGDTATGRVTVNCAGLTSINVSDLYIIDSDNRTIEPLTSPGLPFILPAGSSRNFNILLPIPSDYPNGSHPLTAAVRGTYSTYVLNDTLAGFVDTLIIQSSSLPEYVSGSLTPDTLSSGDMYQLSFRLVNNGIAGLALLDSSYLSFTDGARQYRSALASALYIPPGQPQGVLVLLDSALVASDFTAGSYLPVLNFYGFENGFFRSGSVNISDAVIIQRRAALAYVTGSLNIDSLAGGQLAALSIRVQNTGTADFMVRHESTRLYFTGDGMEFSALSDTTSGNRVDIIAQGTTTFHFAPAIISSGFTPGTYVPNLTFAGWQNGHYETVQFDSDQDSVKVLSPAVVRLDSVYITSLNAPFINTSQACSLKVVFENTGDEAALGFNLRLTRDGASVFNDSIYIQRLDGRAQRVLFIHGNGGAQADPDEILTLAISGGTGAMSQNPLAIGQPLDNTALLITEIPAELIISRFVVTSPPEALDDTISTGQPITVSATIRNLGQAGLTGDQRVVIDAGNYGWIIDTDPRDFELDVPLDWQATSPPTSQDSAYLSLGFASDPRDANDGSRVIGDDSTASLRFVVNTRPFILHNASVTSPDGAIDGVLSTDQVLVVTDTLQPSGIYSRKAAQIQIPEGFTTQDSLTKYPQGNIVNWQLRAPAIPSTGNITVSSWVIDSNTGDSANAAPVEIPVSVVRAASLRLSARIVYPPTALDGIVEPGGSIRIEALVQNNGQAQVGPGQVSLITGRADMVSTEDPIQNFTPGAPVIWNISLPEEEVPLPIPITIMIPSIPLDENSMLPAHTSIDSTAIMIVVRELYPRLVLSNINGHSGSMYKGQSLPYLSFELRNNDIGGNFPIAVDGFNLGLHVNPGGAPSDLLSAVYISSDSGQFDLSAIENGYLRFSSEDSIYLASGASMVFNLMISLSQSTSASDFYFALDADLADALIIENGIPAQNIEAVSARGEPISWQSDPTAIVEQNFASSVSCYPNPFSPREGAAKIGYYLPISSELEVKVFTLLGELVWTKTISSAEPLGSAGLHTGQTALIWDGKNDIGREIRSGVYICLVRNLTSGEEEKFKIAIVK